MKATLRREFKTAVEIQFEVRRLVDRIRSKNGEMRLADMGEVKPLIISDRNGCNWYMEFGIDVASTANESGAAMANVKARWNLSH